MDQGYSLQQHQLNTTNFKSFLCDFTFLNDLTNKQTGRAGGKDGGSGGLTGCGRTRLITNGQHGRYRPFKVRIEDKNKILKK